MPSPSASCKGLAFGEWKITSRRTKEAGAVGGAYTTRGIHWDRKLWVGERKGTDQPKSEVSEDKSCTAAN